MPFGTGTFSLRFVEQETLTKQKRSFNATFSFHRGKWNFISLRLLVQRHTAESKWELGNQNPRRRVTFLLFTASSWINGHQALPPCSGDNIQRFLLNTPQLSWIPATFWPPSTISSDSFYGITFVPPGEVLDGRSVQTTALVLWKLKQPVEFLLSLALEQSGADIQLGPMNPAANLAKTSGNQILLLRHNSFIYLYLTLYQICYNIASVVSMFWLFAHEAYGILAPWAEVKLAPPALEGEVLTNLKS